MIQAFKNNKMSIYTGLGLLVLVVVILIPCMPSMGALNRDSGVFLYIAEQILDGQIPYRDIWDHKGPVIYYIDALGLLVGQGSRWGLWFIELLSLYTATLLGYIVMSRAYGHLPAIFATIMWLIPLPILLGTGNYTEEYSLPLSFAALFLFWYSESKREQPPFLRKGVPFLIGVTLALSFLLRPNNIGVQTSIIIFILLQALLGEDWRERSQAFRENLLKLIMIGSGALSVILLTMGYFALNGSLYEAVDGMLLYNLIYSADRVETFFKGVRLTAGLFLISSVSWFLGLWYAFTSPPELGGTEGGLSGPDIKLLYLSLLGFPIDLLMSGISGKGLTHYYINWLPISALLVAFLVFIILRDDLFRLREAKGGRRTLMVWLLALFFMLNLYTVKESILRVQKEFREKDGRIVRVKEYIEQHTEPDDYLLFWGAEAKFNFITKRKSPTRFIYQYPLYSRAYQSEDQINTLLNDLISKEPIIIDTSPTNDRIPPLDNKARENWDYDDRYQHIGLLAEMDRVFEFINQNYKIIDRIGPGWPVYVYVGD